MKKPNENEPRITVQTQTREEFFSRGRERAKILDAGKKVDAGRIISFEDTEDLIKFITIARLALLNAIRKKPISISSLAAKLHRSRASIDKDIQLLESVGIVESEYVVNPGHGRCRVVKAVDKNPIKLRVETII